MIAEIKYICDGCGSYLVVVGEGDNEISFAYCDTCNERSYNVGFNEGLEDGEDGGEYDNGYEVGYNVGLNDSGFDKGWKAAKDDTFKRRTMEIESDVYSIKEVE